MSLFFLRCCCWSLLFDWAHQDDVQVKKRLPATALCRNTDLFPVSHSDLFHNVTFAIYPWPILVVLDLWISRGCEKRCGIAGYKVRYCECEWCTHYSAKRHGYIVRRWWNGGRRWVHIIAKSSATWPIASVKSIILLRNQSCIACLIVWSLIPTFWLISFLLFC